jgi:two-component system, NarL family, sensor histidine kinase DesK
MAAAPQPPHRDEPPAHLGTGGAVALGVFLVFLGFPLTDMLEAPPGTAHLVAALAGLALFVAVYLRVMLAPRERRDTLVSIGVLALIAAVIAFDDTATWAPLFIYVSAAAGFRLRVRESVRAIAACAAAAGAAGVAGHYDAGDTIQFVIYCVAIGAMLRGYANLVAANRELHAARGEIARLAVSEERLRFARDLHDLLGHSLSVIALKSELAGRLLDADNGRAREEVEDIHKVSRDALVEVREAVSGYRRMTLADELLGAEAALTAAGIEPEVVRPDVSLAPEVESVLAWAVREGTTNVIRHSGARHCAIRVHAGLSDAGVEIVDDGAPPAGDDAAGGGSGLAGLRERVARRHGSLEAARRPEGGFRLAVHVPAAP